MQPRSLLSPATCAILAAGAALALPGATVTATTTSHAAGDTQLAEATLYVAPNGSDSAAGTESAPTTLTSAISRITAGGTIYVRGGTYNLSQTVTIPQGNDGTSSARTKLTAARARPPC